MTKDSWDPQQYSAFKKERAQPFFDLLELIQVIPGGQVVDLGCGSGELTLELHRHLQAARTIGVDSSQQMLDQAAAFAKDGVSFIKSDIASWEPQCPLDLVFSNAALQWCPEHVKLFTKLKNALAPHGQLAIQMPMNFSYPTHTVAAQMSTEEPWASLLNRLPYDRQRVMRTAEEYAILLFQLGFKEQKVFLRVYPHVFASREDVMEWVKGTTLTFFKKHLAGADYEAFVAAYRKRLYSELPDERPFFYPFQRILIWAKL